MKLPLVYSKTLFRITIILMLVIWIMFTSYLMYQSYAGGLSSGNGFFRGITILLIEAAILMLILRPHTLLLEHWLRFLFTFFLFAAWTLFLLVGVFGDGVNRIYIDHINGLFKLDLFLLIFLGASVVARLYIGVADD